MDADLLIVDDQSDFSQTLSENLSFHGFRARCASSGSEALQYLAESAVDLVLLDIRLGGENGIDLLKKLQHAAPRVPVVMITGFASIGNAIESMKHGAVDFVQKPVDIGELVKLVGKVLGKNGSAGGTNADDANRIITNDVTMLRALDRILRIARTDLPVLIVGESGCGKELIADFVHRNSPRNGRQLIKINCAAFPDSLIDSELFGHERGAFTGASSSFQGIFEQADGGTIFLDEIASMPLATQTKVLRVLQNGEIRRVGGDRTMHVDVRFLAATNQELLTLMQGAGFREDLYYRLNTAVIEIPPLRQRKGDILLLANHFLHHFRPDATSGVPTLSAEVKDILRKHQWPGNVRELKNAVHYAAAICTGDVIRPRDLPANLQHNEATPQAPPLSLRGEHEKELILKVLAETDNNKKRAAELLGMSRNTLYSRMREYGLM